MSERKKRGRGRSRSSGQPPLTSYPGRILVLLALLVAPWLVGSVSAWAQFGLAAVLVAAVVFWFLELAVTRPRYVVLPLSVLPILMGVALGIFQLWPLSPQMADWVGAGRNVEQWELFGSLTPQDHEVAEKIEIETGRSVDPSAWAVQPTISLDPDATRLMTVQLLFAGLAYVLGAHYFHQPRTLLWLCLILTVNGLALAAFGMVQRMTGNPGELLFGLVQVEGTGFASYINRNNAAGWLVMCMSAAVVLVTITFSGSSDDHGAETQEEWLLNQHSRGDGAWHGLLRMVHELDAKKMAAVFALVFIVAGVVSTLSRGGSLAMILGSIIGFLLIGVTSPRRSGQGVQYLAVAVLMGLVLVAWLGFGQKIMERFEQADQRDLLEDSRVENWRETAAVFPEQWLVGSGLDSYRHVHRPFRSSPETGLFAFAENQYFQTLIDAGLLGGLLLAAMLIWTVCLTSYLLKRARSRAMIVAGTLGGVALGSQAVAAFFDFGLYIPANTMTFAVVMGCVAGQAQYQALRDPLETRLASRGFGPLSVPLLLLLMGGSILGLSEFYRQGQLESALLRAQVLRRQEHRSDLGEMDRSLEHMERLAAAGRNARLQASIADQWIHRQRLGDYRRILATLPEVVDETGQTLVWQSTEPRQRLAYLRQLRQVSPPAAARLEQELAANTANRIQLLSAYHELLMSRSRLPLRPETHLRLAELGSWFSPQPPDAHLDRALQIAPKNPHFQVLAGIQKLEASGFDPGAENFEPALEHLRIALELDSRAVRSFESAVLKKSILGARVDGLDSAVYARKLLLDYPDLLLDLTNRDPDLQRQPELRLELLRETKEGMEQRRQSFVLNLAEAWAMGRIEMELQQWQAASQQFDLVLQMNPAHAGARFQRALARFELGELERASEDLRSLMEVYPEEARYRRAWQRVQDARLQ